MAAIIIVWMIFPSGRVSLDTIRMLAISKIIFTLQIIIRPTTLIRDLIKKNCNSSLHRLWSIISLTRRSKYNQLIRMRQESLLEMAMEIPLTKEGQSCQKFHNSQIFIVIPTFKRFKLKIGKIAVPMLRKIATEIKRIKLFHY